jgi:phosphoserine phosphatase RsbU/P
MGDVNRYLKEELAKLQHENQNLREEVILLREYVGAVESLMDAVNELDPKAEIIPLLDRILYNAMTVTNSKDGSLLVVDEESNELAFVIAKGDVSTEKLAGQRLPMGKGIAGWVAQNKKPTIVNQAKTDPRFFTGIDDAFKFTTNSVLAVPIVGNNKVLGIIEVLNKQNGHAYEMTDQMLLEMLCRFAGECLATMAAQEEADAAKAEAKPAPEKA